MQLFESFDSIGYARRQRLQYIESVAYWEGVVDRPRVCKVFELSENHISKDFTCYRKAFPDNLSYDPTARAYRPGKFFEPKIGSGSAEEYLALLRAFHETKSVGVLPTIGTGVSATGLPVPSGTINPKVLRELTRALSQGRGLTVLYQSFSKPEPVAREIWPHALVFAGLRWHVRAYDALRQDFVDLVLLRVIEAKPLDEKAMFPPSKDARWSTTEEVAITTQDGLSPTQRQVVAIEYGMQKDAHHGWVWRSDVRQALIGYLLNALRLDAKSNNHPHIRLVDRELATRYQFL